MNLERHKDEEWSERVEGAYSTILHSLLIDPEPKPELPDGYHSEISCHTPARAMKAFDFLTSGYRMNLKDVVGKGVFMEEDIDELILVRDIEFYSLCEHHMLPFFGKIHVGYIPGNCVIGLSKIQRIVDMFAHRLQLQERFTMNVARGLEAALTGENKAEIADEITAPKGIAVLCEGQHLCMCMRGVEKQNSMTISSAMLGVFRDEGPARAEFMATLQFNRSH